MILRIKDTKGSQLTLVGSTGSTINVNDVNDKDSKGGREFDYSQAPTSPLPERKRKSVVNDSTNRTVACENGSKTADTPQKKPTETEDTAKSVKKSETENSKPKIVSALTKTAAKDSSASKVTLSQHSTPNKTSSNVLQPMSYLTMNRRPSAGTIGVPVAALSQHRRSLQLNSSDGGFGMSKVRFFGLKYKYAGCDIVDMGNAFLVE